MKKRLHASLQANLKEIAEACQLTLADVEDVIQKHK
jgi:hypothetical protein